RRREPGVLPYRPRLGDVHCWVGAAQVGCDPRPSFEKVQLIDVSFAIERFDSDTLGREPWVEASGRSRDRRRVEGDLGEIGDAGHDLSSRMACLSSMRAKLQGA